MADQPEAPFEAIPSAIEIARYFWHEIVMVDQEAPYRRGQYHGCDGIDLWRDGDEYCYLWVAATSDHDMWVGYLLEVRTKTGGIETRDHVYLAAGGSDYFEVAWKNWPIRYDADFDAAVENHRAAMIWFANMDEDTILKQNGGDQGVIDRALARGETIDPDPVALTGLGAAITSLLEEHWPNSGVNGHYLADLLRTQTERRERWSRGED